MARVSRKQGNGQVQDKAAVKAYGKAKYKVAVYARLSVESEESLERGSIDNQVELVKSYIGRQEDMEIVDTYVDDAFSGTNFERPGFNRMMADMRAGKINTIVVKDLSRLGRDYLETGNLIERVFPMYGVRFVAILDGFDSAKGSAELMVSVSNIANALYAQDISKKVYSSVHEKMAKGIPPSTVPFGYKSVLADDNTRHMVLDDYAACIVRRIADYYLEGKATKEVAAILNSENIPTPMQYRYRNDPKKCANVSYAKWNNEMLVYMMRNAVYTGKYVTGKRQRCLYRHEANHYTTKKEWVVFENHHDAIISRDEYFRINAGLGKADHNRVKIKHFFKGKMVCNKCGSAMKIQRSNNKVKRLYYICNRKGRYGKSGCDCENVGKQEVDQIVFDVLKEEMQLMLDQEAAIRILRRSDQVQKKKDLLCNAHEKYTKEFKKINEMKGNLYQDMQDGLLSEQEYITLNREYSDRLIFLQQQCDDYQNMIDRFSNDPLDCGDVKELIGKFIRKRKLSQEMVDGFVDKIIVHDQKRIEVILKYADVRERLSKVLEEMEG